MKQHREAVVLSFQEILSGCLLFWLAMFNFWNCFYRALNQ